MIAGALAGMAAALMSEREDWRERVPYFAFFGALGWAFGGSIAYMHPSSYTETGHLPTRRCMAPGDLPGRVSLGGTGRGRGGLRGGREAVRSLPPSSGHWRGSSGFGRSSMCSRTHRFIWPSVYPRQRERTAPGSGSVIRSLGFDSEWLEAVYALTALCLFDLWDSAL